MVKNTEDPYSFHLDSTGESLSSGSSTTTSTLCKEKIDRIFAEKRRTILGLPNGVPSAFSNREEQDKFKQHLQSQIQRIVNERRGRLEKELHVKEPAKSKNGYDEHIDKLFSEACDTHDTASLAESGSVSLSVSVTPSNSTDVSFEAPSVRPGHGRKLPPDPSRTTMNNTTVNVTSTDDECASTIDPGYGIFYQHTRTKVEYLGCLPLNDKATHLEVLQLPLKQLYFQHLALTSRGQSPLRGTVEITGTGLKLQYYREERAGVQEIFNPFPTIAVWAAVKFVVRKTKFAFLPLICDPESQEKHKLFHDLDEVPSVVDLGGTVHPPLFACVMRKVGLSRILECHGFMCSSSEDAIVLAANLYQALLDNMKEDNCAANVYGESSLQNEERHPVGRPRSASINHVQHDEIRAIRSEDSQPIPPPRKKRGQIYDSNYSEAENQLGPSKRSVSEEALTRTQAIAFKKEAKERMSTRGTRESRVRRSASDRHHAGCLTDSEASGDLYTHVALPRSKSFMNVSGQYDLKDLFLEMKTRKLHSVDDLLKEIINPKGMSFSEMKPVYRDLLLKLALTLSKDEIYQRSKNIMRKHNKKRGHMGGLMGVHTPQDSDTDGSAISSVFKATKRSLSKFTSMRQKPSEKRYNVAAKSQANWRSSNKSKSIDNLAEVSSAKLAKEMQDEKLTKVNSSGFAAAVGVKSNDLAHKGQPRKKTHAPLPPAIKAKTPLPNRKLPPLPVEACSGSECGYDSESCESYSKCYCSLKHESHHHSSEDKNRASPLSCKCDSDSCVESEKCYCSLRVKTKDGKKFYTIALDSGTETDTTINSTISSGQKKKLGGSAGNLSGFDSPLTAWRKNSGMSSYGMENPDRPPSHIVASRRSSLDPLYIGSMSMFNVNGNKGPSGDSQDADHHARRRPSMAKPRSKSTDNLSPIEKAIAEKHAPSETHHKKKKMLVVSAVDPSGKVVYQGASDPRNSSSNNRHHRPSFAHKTKSAASAFLGSMLSTGSNGSDEEGSPAVAGTLSSDTLLSFKKTAEIAALFSEVKFSQTTNIVDNDSLYSESSEDDAYSSMQNLTSGQNSLFMFSDTNIENSLGYLP